jgi:hypothetical protein
MGTVLGMHDIDQITRIKDELDLFCSTKGLAYDELSGIVRDRFP